MNQITAKVIADSVFQGHRLTTLILEYPRFIHSEFMTHRVFSRNASSSRAIPVRTMLWQVIRNPAMPVHWGKNQPGMQAKEELSPLKTGVSSAMACFWGHGSRFCRTHAASWVAQASCQ